MLRKVLFYWGAYGFIALLKKIWTSLYELITTGGKNEAEIVNEKNTDLMPMYVFYSPAYKSRVNLVVVDQGDLDNSSLDVPILFSLILAHKWNYGLRLITSSNVDKSYFYDLLKFSGIPFRKNVEFILLDKVISGKTLDVSESEVFITTTCLGTYKVIDSINENKVIYMLQTDERTSSPADEYKQICNQILKNPHINFLATTRQLYDNFTNEGFDNIAARGAYLDGTIHDKKNHLPGNMGMEDWDKILTPLSGFLNRILLHVSV